MKHALYDGNGLFGEIMIKSMQENLMSWTRQVKDYQKKVNLKQGQIEHLTNENLKIILIFDKEI